MVISQLHSTQSRPVLMGCYHALSKLANVSSTKHNR
jgi:hypothetical protein